MRIWKMQERCLRGCKGKVDAVFHLGDHDDDAVALQQEFPKLPFHYVKE